MYSIAIAVFCGAGTGLALRMSGAFGWGWSVFFAFLGYGIVQMSIGMVLQRKVKAAMKAVEATLQAGQKAIQEKTRRWQVRPPGSMQAAQKEIERDQRKVVAEALEMTEPLHRFDRWVPMMKRQIATAQFQLHWMVKEYRKCDALMDLALFLDPVTCSMKIARMHALGMPTDEIRKVYRKAVRRVRYNQNVLPAAVWTWVLVKRNEIDEAFKALNEALKNSDNETLKANRDALANNRVEKFSNAGIGDTWWSLGLEEQKIRMPRQRMQWR